MTDPDPQAVFAPLFSPRTVAVVGASSSGIGRQNVFIRRGSIRGLRFSGVVTLGNGGGTSVLATDFFSGLGIPVFDELSPAALALSALHGQERFVRSRSSAPGPA